MAKPNIYILATKRKGKNGERVTLHQRIYLNGEQKQIALNISIPAKDYNADNEMVVGGDSMDIYNRTIQTSKQTLKDILLRYELIEHRIPGMDEIISDYRKAMSDAGLLYNKESQKKLTDSAKDHSLPAYIDAFIKDQQLEKQWSEGTCKKFKTLKKHLKEYKPQINIADLSSDYLYGLVTYWVDKKKYDNTTIHRYLKHIRWYLRWCYGKGYYTGNLHDAFRPKLKGSEFENKTIIFLTQEELQLLEDFIPGSGQSHLERVRDIFLFSCYSGLRFSDVQNLKPVDIINDSIHVITQKTDDQVTINLNKHTRAILNKYKDWVRMSGKCLPTISNQKTNAYLHDLCKLVKIDTPTKQISYSGDKMKEIVVPKYELITFHAARRTFITHAARLGIPAEVIMKFSGHHSAEMLKPYMEIVEELKKQEMAKFDDM